MPSKTVKKKVVTKTKPSSTQPRKRGVSLPVVVSHTSFPLASVGGNRDHVMATIASDTLSAESPDRPRFTGRQLVVLNRDSSASEIEKQARTMSVRMANSRDFKSDENSNRMLTTAFAEADGIVFDKLKIAIVNEQHGHQLSSLTTSTSTRKHFIKTEPERFVYKLFAKRLARHNPVLDDSIATWGVHAVNALQSSFTGRGVNVAILDTGFDSGHPDFRGRTRKSKSFIPGQPVKDLDGHGTHCTGIACGNIHHEKKFRYGVANEANIYIGKVLSNNGVGTDSTILAGIEWALKHRCRVISLSLGDIVLPGETYYDSYESVAQTALDHKCLIIAAAGNDSIRSRGKIKPVNHPANCPSIMAVAAIDHAFDIADFSCGGLHTEGGQVDIAAPGVDVYSSYKNHRYRRLDGTSQATPFVAGVAALLWESSPRSSAERIWMKLVQEARRLNLKASDVGAGLVWNR